MNTESPRGKLGSLSTRARERLAAEPVRRRGAEAEPGDLFVLAATAELPVEWAVLDRRPASGELLVVPADTSPLAGGGDVEVLDGSPGGPLTLRCRYGLWLDGALFDRSLRTGVLAEEAVTEALERMHQVESGLLAASPLAEEVEADPEYQDWIREVPARARELAAAGRSRRGAQAVPRRPWRAAEMLAAVLALATLGLSLWALQLRREVVRLSAPVFNPPAEEVVLGAEPRARTVIQVPREASQVILTLVLDRSLPPQEGRLEIVGGSGAVLWGSPRVRLVPPGELMVIVPRKLLADGEYLIRLVPASGAGTAAAMALKVETAR